MNLNVVYVAGNLTADPELKTTNNNTPVCQFTVAVNKYTKGERKAEFIRCKAWKEKAEMIVRYFKRGHPIFIGGFLETTNWIGDDGKKGSVTEVVVNDVQFVLTKRDTEAEYGGGNGDQVISVTKTGGNNVGMAGNIFSAPQDVEEAELPF